MEQLLGDVRAVFPAPASELVLVATAFFCGALVGVERERNDKPAGLRTLILICMGSTIFTLVSLHPPLGGQEPARIAAQIVTGVGFLGAGAILRERRGLVGLTTAATIWATAGIGIVIGAGYAAGGVGLSLSVLFTLWVVKGLESRVSGLCETQSVLVLYRPHRGKTRALVQEVIDEARGRVDRGPEREWREGLVAFPLTYCFSHRDHRRLLAELAHVPGVEGFADEASE